MIELLPHVKCHLFFCVSDIQTSTAAYRHALISTWACWTLEAPTLSYWWRSGCFPYKSTCRCYLSHSMTKPRVFVCVLSGIRYHCAVQDGGCESQRRAHRLADPPVRPHHHGRGPVLHHRPGVLLLTGSSSYILSVERSLDNLYALKN